RREVLGMQIGASEAEPFWTEFLRSLTRRGLRGVCAGSSLSSLMRMKAKAGGALIKSGLVGWPAMPFDRQL
ncbi:MAG: hypothetical protein RL230_3088, partial [Pseudomonadota bacterium]